VSDVSVRIKWPDNVAATDAVVRAAIPDLAQAVYDATEPRVPVGATGALKKGLGIRIRKGGLEAAVGVFGARHAHLVMRGTKAHAIPGAKHRRKKALVIARGESMVIRHSAEHPGARKNPFLQEGLRASEPRLNQLLQQHGEGYLAEAVKHGG
jgi:hypothetical protein